MILVQSVSVLNILLKDFNLPRDSTIGLPLQFGLPLRSIRSLLCCLKLATLRPIALHKSI